MSTANQKPNLTARRSKSKHLKTRTSLFRPHTTGPRNTNSAQQQTSKKQTNTLQTMVRTQSSVKQWKSTWQKNVEEREAREKPIEVFRRISKSVRVISGICLVVKRYAQKGVQMEMETIQANLKLFADFDFMLAFTLDTQELSIKPVISDRLKSILVKKPHLRTEKEVQSVNWVLKEHDSYQGYPLATQVELCKCMNYQRYEARRIIIRMGHPAEGFYLIVSGCVMINSYDNKGQPVVKEKAAGSTFGEMELFADVPRKATYVCKTDVELMVIFKEDFDRIIKGPQLQQKERHFDYLRTLPLFKTFPIENLKLTSGDFFHKYYKKGKVVVSSANDNDYVIVIQSGKCDVIAELSGADHSRPQTASSRSCTPGSTSEKSRDMNKHFPVITYQKCAQDRMNRSKTAGLLQWETGQMQNNMYADIITGCTTTDKLLKREEAKILQHNKSTANKQQKKSSSSQKRYIHLSSLHAGSFFGLESIFQDYKTKLVLISDGSECIFIARKAFIRESNPDVLEKVSKLVTTYPSEEYIKNRIDEKQKWESFKKNVVSDVLIAAKPTVVREQTIVRL